MAESYDFGMIELTVGEALPVQQPTAIRAHLCVSPMERKIYNVTISVNPDFIKLYGLTPADLGISSDVSLMRAVYVPRINTGKLHRTNLATFEAGWNAALDMLAPIAAVGRKYAYRRLSGERELFRAMKTFTGKVTHRRQADYLGVDRWLYPAVARHTRKANNEIFRLLMNNWLENGRFELADLQAFANGGIRATMEPIFTELGSDGLRRHGISWDDLKARPSRDVLCKLYRVYREHVYGECMQYVRPFEIADIVQTLFHEVCWGSRMSSARECAQMLGVDTNAVYLGRVGEVDIGLGCKLYNIWTGLPVEPIPPANFNWKRFITCYNSLTGTAPATIARKAGMATSTMYNTVLKRSSVQLRTHSKLFSAIFPT